MNSIFELPRLKPAKENLPAIPPACSTSDFDRLPVSQLAHYAMKLESHSNFKELHSDDTDPALIVGIVKDVFDLKGKFATEMANATLVCFLRVILAHRQVAGGEVRPIQRLIDKFAPKIEAVIPPCESPMLGEVAQRSVPVLRDARVEHAPGETGRAPGQWGKLVRERCGFGQEKLLEE